MFTVQSKALIDPGLIIKTSSSAIVKSANNILVQVGRKTIRKAAGDMPALTGTIATLYCGIYGFYIDAAGTLSVAKGTDYLISLGYIPESGWPVTPAGTSPIGYLILDNGTASTFTGGITALDTALLVPYYTYRTLTA